MGGYIGKVKIGSDDTMLIGSTLYGITTTSASNPNKKVTETESNSTNFINKNYNSPIVGSTIHVKFTNGNKEASGCKLQVGTTSAYDVVGDFRCPENTIISFTLDENYKWVVNDNAYINTTYTFAQGTTTGAFQVTPSSGDPYSVSIYGLGSAAYTEADIYATSSYIQNNYAPINSPTFTGTVIVPAILESSSGTVAATKDYVDNKFSSALETAGSAMVFQGTIGTTGAMITNVPANGYKKGWTYRVVGDFTFGSGTAYEQNCEDGDLIIAIDNGPSTGNTVDYADWTIVQNNLDGAVITTGGTSGSLAKFNGTHTLVDGPAFTSGSTGFLKQDGTWATPTDTRDPGYGQVTIAAKSTSTDNLTPPDNAVTVSAIIPNETLKITPANKWVTITGSNSTSSGSDEIKFAHLVPSTISNSFASQGTQTPTYGGNFIIPNVAFDEAGHITGITSLTVTLPASDNTDEKVKQSPYSTSTDYNFDILFKTSSNHTEETNNVNFSTVTNKTLTFNPSTGTLNAAIFKGSLDSTVLGTDDTVTSALTFYHKSGSWKTLSVSNTTTTIASVSQGVLNLASSVKENAVLNMASPS